MIDSAPALELDAIAARLDRIGLGDLGGASLMDRVDLRFVMPAALGPELLRRCGRAFHVLDVEGRRSARYRTVYFDTPDLDLYHAHHAGRTPRRKVRLRSYLDTDRHFLEVKTRHRARRTTKERVVVDGIDTRPPVSVLQRLTGFPPGVTEGLDPARLAAVLTTTFTRLTLVDRFRDERVTLDLGFTATLGGGQCDYHRVMFVELKQARRGPSPVLDALATLGARRGAMSKYCIGIVSLHETARKHRYRQAHAELRHLDALRVPRASPR